MTKLRKSGKVSQQKAMGFFQNSGESRAFSAVLEAYLCVYGISLPLLAGEQNDLTRFCHVLQNGQRRLVILKILAARFKKEEH